MKELVEESLKSWAGTWQDQSDPAAPHEANLLNLTIEKARQQLGWQPRWNFNEAIEQTISWYREVLKNRSNPVELCREQIRRYVEA